MAAAHIIWQCLTNLDDTMVMKLQATVGLTVVWSTNPTIFWCARPKQTAHYGISLTPSS